MYENFVLLGDFNMSTENPNLKNFMCSFDCNSLTDSPSCYKSICSEIYYLQVDLIGFFFCKSVLSFFLCFLLSVRLFNFERCNANSRKSDDFLLPRFCLTTLLFLLHFCHFFFIFFFYLIFRVILRLIISFFIFHICVVAMIRCS